MAVDEALLEESIRTETIFVRMYRWSEATISLGHFQNASEQNTDARLADLPTVRRLSGGGAILHHHEQTYCCVIPPGHPLASRPYQLYEAVHSAIIETLAKFGVELVSRGRDGTNDREPFLCFLREAAADLVSHGVKVLGSAQRRRKGAVLQHGSLLLQASEYAPNLLGLRDLDPGFQTLEKLPEMLGQGIANVLGSTFVQVPLPGRVSQFVALSHN